MMKRIAFLCLSASFSVGQLAATEADIPALLKVSGEAKNLSPELTKGEIAAFARRIQQCWNLPAGAKGNVSVKFNLDKSGKVVGRPVIIDKPIGSSNDDMHVAAALRAVLRCQPYSLPAQKYDRWSEVIFNFDPSEMLQ
jgi:colicin import membrane protein